MSLTLKDVAADIGWIDAFGGDEMEFDAADYSRVNATGQVILQGRTFDGQEIDVIVTITEVAVGGEVILRAPATQDPS